MQRRTAGVLAATAATALTAGLIAGPAAAERRAGGDNPQAIGLTVGQRLAAFSVDSPENARNIGLVTGLDGDTRLIGIDYRVQNNSLYGVGEAGGIYRVSRFTAEASKVAQLTVTPNGTNFGVDFNPAANALRIVSDTGQNLRYSFAMDTTTADTGLTYPPSADPVTGVAAAAYTNNDLNENTGTTLFDIDASLDQVAAQAPANAGTLSPTGKLGQDAGNDAGFDIYSKLQADGKTSANRGYAALSVNGRYQLFGVSLLTGDVSQVGRFPEKLRVADLAILLDK